MRNKAINRPFNTLWISRQRIGLGQKSVARLLGIRSKSPIPEYETGRLLPNLRTALKLSAIYGVPLNELYEPLYREVQEEVESISRGSIYKPRVC